MRRPLSPEIETGWFAGPYPMEMLGPAFWGLTHEGQQGLRFLDPARSPRLLAQCSDHESKQDRS